jgi:metal-sulfur cluster biosynthetic enzyme
MFGKKKRPRKSNTGKKWSHQIPTMMRQVITPEIRTQSILLLGLGREIHQIKGRIL